MEISYPPHTKRTCNILEHLKFEVELRARNKKESGGLFGFKKDIVSKDEKTIFGWLDRNEHNSGAIQPRKLTASIMKYKHLNFFESFIQANIRKED